jgi:PHD/YefM family antitoxin component YafN of YafNO toxin-antitoxin module
MIKLHPEFLKKDGKPAFVVLPYEEFKAIEEALDDAEDLRVLRSAREQEGPAETQSLQEVKARYGLE